MKTLVILLSILPWQNLLQEAKQHYMNYENDSCAVKVAAVRDYCRSHQDVKGVHELSADVENVLGALAQVDGQRDSAALHYQNAYGYVMKTADRGKAPMYCINVADVLRQEGDAPKAAQWLRRALSLSDSLEVHDLDCAINTQLGQVYADLRNMSMAQTYFEAAELSCESGSFDDYFLANARGNACFFDEDYENAVSCFRRARAAALATGNEFNLRVTELNLGECCLSLHQLDSASVYIDRSYDFWSTAQYSDESILGAIYGMKAGLALEKGDVRQAAIWLSKESACPSASPIYTNLFNRHMMEISALKGDWKEAYAFSRKMHSYSDSLSRATLLSNFAEAEMRYSRDTTVLHQQTRIALQQSRIFRMWVWIALCLLALTACAEVIVQIQKARKAERRRTQEIINSLKLENLKNARPAGKIAVEDPVGDRFVSSDEIVLLTYQPDSRRWNVLLRDKSEAVMKRGTRAEQILAISPSLTKLNQGTIVNVDYIKSIGAKDNSCTLVEPFSRIRLQFSRRTAKSVKG